jgi:flagellar hook capping protein FlgD
MVVALVAGTVAAMIVTQRARDEGPVAFNIAMKTKPGRYRPCFRLTRDDTVDVAIVDAEDRVVKMLAQDQPLKGDDTAHCFDWDGRDDAGQYVAPGRYRLRLTLVDADRVATSGERLRIPPGGPPS